MEAGFEENINTVKKSNFNTKLAQWSEIEFQEFYYFNNQQIILKLAKKLALDLRKIVQNSDPKYETRIIF